MITPISIKELPDIIQTQAQDNVKGYARFEWIPQVYGNNVTTYLFTINGSRWHLFYTQDEKLHVSPRAKIYSILNYVQGNTREIAFSKLRSTKTKLEDSLEDKWGIGHQAELYMNLAIQNRISIKTLMNCSPLILSCFNNHGTTNKLHKEYDHSSIKYVTGLTQFTNDKQELLNMLHNLPEEVIEAMIAA